MSHGGDDWSLAPAPAAPPVPTSVPAAAASAVHANHPSAVPDAVNQLNVGLAALNLGHQQQPAAPAPWVSPAQSLGLPAPSPLPGVSAAVYNSIVASFKPILPPKFTPPTLPAAGAPVTLQDLLNACILHQKKFLVDNFDLTAKSLNTQNESGHTMMYCAARNNAVDCLQYLIDLGANIHIRQQSVQSTPLHAAAWYGAKDAVELLLKKGASPDIKNCHGLTPKQEASMSASPHRAAILELFDRCTKAVQLPDEMAVIDQAATDNELVERMKVFGYVEPDTIRWIIKDSQHVHLVPHLPFTKDAQSNTPLLHTIDPRCREWELVTKAMNTSILTVHESSKSTPYVRFDIDAIQRHQNPATLAHCMEHTNEANTALYLFHGTSKAAIDPILQGFQASASGDFGSGIYFADHSSVSNLFARDKKNDDGFSYMLLCYVNAGTIEQSHKGPEGGKGARFKGGNTVIVTHQKYKEYIVYNPKRIYPAYVIKYKEVPLSSLEKPQPV